MFHFKRVAVAFLAVLAVSACTKADKADGVNGDLAQEDSGTGGPNNTPASFYVRSVSGSGVVVKTTEIYENEKTGEKFASDWRVPKSVTFTFSACIDDRATRKEAIGHKFEVVDPDKNLSVLDVTPTRPNGCFTWMENHPFSFFVKKSRWVVVERDIVGTGIHSGRQRIRLALNPWTLGKDARDSGDAVVFLRDNAFPKSLVGQLDKETHQFGGDSFGEDGLFVDDVHIQTVRRGERNTGTYVRLNISMEPKVRFENSAGSPGFRHIDSGQFYVIGHLVLNGAGVVSNGADAEHKKDRVILTSAAGAVPGGNESDIGVRGQGRVIDGKLIARLDAWIDPRLPQGNLELVIKLIPRGIKGLGSFEGIYELGALKNLSGSMSGSLSEECRDVDGGCKIAPYLKESNNFEMLLKQGLASHNSPYLFDRLRLRFVQVQPGETTTQRSVAYSASTCVIDAFTGDRVVNLPFNIKYNDSDQVIRKATAEDGCLNWDSTIFHQYYQPEEFIEKIVTISRDTGVSRDLKFYINPWDDKFTFGFDEREFTPDFWEKIKKRKKIKSRFFLADYGYHTVKFQYNIDNLMSLEVRKTVLMELEPRVLRYSGIINARKMTEPLRDGIWLMKVGIQKNYLDPAQAGLVTDTLQEAQSDRPLSDPDKEKDRKRTDDRLQKLGIEAQQKEYISTQTSLVRVTDGVIIQPVELKMQDLRMMRVRTNMMIQLEAVDERKLQAENALHDGLNEEMEQLLEKRRKLNEDLGKDGLTEDEKTQIKEEEDKIRARVEDRRKLSRRAFGEISKMLSARGAYQINLDTFQLDEGQLNYLKPLLEKIDLELQKNDFTNIHLPPCMDTGETNSCNLFVETDSGLERRSFVGPVIFLSNAYKDSVRATDNLDEALCSQKKVDYDDKFEEDLRDLERQEFADADSKVAKERQNTFYRYSRYFGSLRHLCFAQVDDLIAREREYRRLYQNSGAAVASIFQFAKSYNLGILSLADEKPKDVEISHESVERCHGDLVSCMRETEEHFVPRDSALKTLNDNLKTASINESAPWRWVSSKLDDVKLTPWSLEDFRSALFDGKSPRAARYAGCVSAAEATISAVQKAGGTLPRGYSNWQEPKSDLINHCVDYGDSALQWDKKLRVFQTGQSGDSYIFLGGLQLNLNVGQSFAVGRSDSYSGSVGFELGDTVGWLGGAQAGGALAGFTIPFLKPFSLKVSKSSSLSDSNGTSVADSTYLVAQIAGFKVRLDDYERCNVLTWDKAFLDAIVQRGRFAWGAFSRANYELLRAQNGALVCEGVHNDPNVPKYVRESYYYFTQHFTEGDMLDQADLYNHPWLMALRGRRDFAVFLDLIRAQEAVSIKNFGTGIINGAERGTDWPLEQMLSAYKKMTPSFPGFYTDLGEKAGAVAFPLERRMKKIDLDINYEVTSPDRRKDEMRQDLQ